MEEDIRSLSGLDYIEFQVLSPKHMSRCDLFISRDGIREKVASGNVKLFASYLPQVEMQIGRGKQRVRLESFHGSKDSWFTKATLERFIKFVNTPDVIECIESLEDEISQLEQTQKWLLSGGACNGLCEQRFKTHILRSHLEGENGASDASKKDLMGEMDTLLGALHEEQDIAFSRATAAGFDEKSIANLITFSDQFHANRLKDGCMRFLTLWRKRKTMMISTCKIEALIWPGASELRSNNNRTNKPAEDDPRVFSLPGKASKESKPPRNFESSCVDFTLTGHAFNGNRRDMVRNKLEKNCKQSLGKSQFSAEQGPRHSKIHKYEQIHSSPEKSPALPVIPNVICSKSHDAIAQSENGKDSDSLEDREENAHVVKLHYEGCSLEKNSIEGNNKEETHSERLTVRAAISMFESKKTTLSRSWGEKKATTDNTVQKLRRQESCKTWSQSGISSPCVQTLTSDNMQEKARHIEFGLMKHHNQTRVYPSSQIRLTKQARSEVSDLVQTYCKKSVDSIMHLDKLEQPKGNSAQKLRRQENHKILTQSCTLPPSILSDNLQEKGRNLEVELMKNKNETLGNPSSHISLAKQTEPEANKAVQGKSKKSMGNLTCHDKLKQSKQKYVRKLGNCKVLTQSCSSLPQRQIWISDNFQGKGRTLEVSLIKHKNDLLEAPRSRAMLAKKIEAEANINLVQENSQKSIDNRAYLHKLEQPKGNHQCVVADIVSKRQLHQARNSPENTLFLDSESCIRLDDTENLSDGTVDSVIPFEIKVKLSFQSKKNHASPVEGKSILSRLNLHMAEIQEKNISRIPSCKPIVTKASTAVSTSNRRPEQSRLEEAAGIVWDESQETSIIREMSSIPAPHRSNILAQYSMNNSEQSITTLTGAYDRWHSNPQTKSVNWEQTPCSNAFAPTELHMIALMKMAENRYNNNEKTTKQRGKFYEQYSRSRDARIKSEPPSNKAQREARLKSMQETFLQRNFQLKTEILKFSRKQACNLDNNIF